MPFSNKLSKPFKGDPESKYRPMENPFKSKKDKPTYTDNQGYGGGNGRETSFDYSKSNIKYVRLEEEQENDRKNDRKKK